MPPPHAERAQWRAKSPTLVRALFLSLGRQNKVIRPIFAGVDPAETSRFSLVMRECEKCRPMKILRCKFFFLRSWCLLRRRNKRVPGQATAKAPGPKGKRRCTTAAKADEKHTMLLSRTYRTNRATRGLGPAKVRDGSTLTRPLGLNVPPSLLAAADEVIERGRAAYFRRGCYAPSTTAFACRATT